MRHQHIEPNLPVSDIDQARLKQEYESIVSTWPKLGMADPLPTYEQWLGINAIVHQGIPLTDHSIGDIRLFNAVEKLVTNLRQYNFAFTHIGAEGKKMGDFSAALSDMMVESFKLPPHYRKRFNELFSYYPKSLAQTLEAEHVVFTPAAHASLIEGLHKLIGRTNEAIAEHEVEVERAIGRIEGAAALLVRTHTMTREKAAHETDEFKKAARKKK